MRTQNFKKDIDYRLFCGLSIVMVLLSGIFAENALGIGPLCSPCDTPIYDFYGHFIKCSGCIADCSSCFSCNTSTNPPSCNYKCNGLNCEECFDCAAGCTSYCYPSLCQTCDGHGNCPVCDGNEFKLCCNGTCYDIRTQECCGGSIHEKGNCMACVNDAWVYTCNLLTQCCVNEICLPKCDPFGGGVCDWTPPPAQDPQCTYMWITNHHCINPGASCSWVTVEGPGLNAKCRPCGCELSSTYCVMLRPNTCNDVDWPVFPWYECICGVATGLVEDVPRGTRYICAAP